MLYLGRRYSTPVQPHHHHRDGIHVQGRSSPIVEVQPDNFAPGFKASLQPTPKQRPMPHYHGRRTKQRNLQQEIAARQKSGGSAPGHDGVEGLMVHGAQLTPIEAPEDLKARQGRLLAERVVNTLQGLGSQQPPATADELEVFKSEVVQIQEAVADIRRKYLSSADATQTEKVKQQLDDLQESRSRLVAQAKQIGIEVADVQRTSPGGVAGEHGLSSGAAAVGTGNGSRQGAAKGHSKSRSAGGAEIAGGSAGTSSSSKTRSGGEKKANGTQQLVADLLDETPKHIKDLKKGIADMAQELKRLEGDQALEGYGKELATLKDRSDAAEYTLRENHTTWNELKSDYDSVFNADAYVSCTSPPPPP